MCDETRAHVWHYEKSIYKSHVALILGIIILKIITHETLRKRKANREIGDLCNGYSKKFFNDQTDYRRREKKGYLSNLDQQLWKIGKYDACYFCIM